MRRLFTLAVAMLIAVSAFAQQPEGARLELSSKVVDLGELTTKSPKQRIDVEYCNTGDMPLVLLEVRTSCTCTKVHYERRKLMPGEKSVICIEMEPSKAPVGSFYRVLQLLSTAKDSPNNLTLKAEITK